jgi:hypothetical protein
MRASQGENARLDTKRACALVEGNMRAPILKCAQSKGEMRARAKHLIFLID